jgi:cytochrome P450
LVELSRNAFPLGASLTVHELEADPYPAYARLQQNEPISWVRELGLWYVTKYEDVRAIVMDADRFTTAASDSLIFDTFGAHMLTTEGAEHLRYRRAVQHSFTPQFVRTMLEAQIGACSERLVASFESRGEVELRAEFAARLPIQTILAVFGLPEEAESLMRRWYDGFERALANFTRDPEVRRVAQENVAQFHDFLDDTIGRAAGHGSRGLLATLVKVAAEERLSDEEIRRNMSIILFGGISTVEALILNSLWALFAHPHTLARVRADLGLAPRVIDETIRWLGPVQSATRHVVRDTTYKGVELEAGDTVNCMIAAANRDPAVFPEPQRFDIDRPNLQRHLGFATGVHACLGLHLAKAEGRIALTHLLERLPGLRLVADKSSPPQGYEFRQPRALHLAWDTHKK